METASSPKVTIVIAALNSEQTVGECLKSIFELDYPRDSLEVILIDGCSTDDTVKIAEKYPVKIFTAPLNAPAAYNYALKIAGSEILGLIDSDAKVEKEWLRKLITHLDDPKVAGASGGIETWNAENPWARSIGYDIKNRYNRLGKYASRIATMNLLLKKSVVEECGGFDEGLPAQYDTDFGFRLTQKGYRFAYDSNAKCYHYHRSTLRSYFNQQLQYGKNTIKLYFKHSSLIKGDEITDFWMNIQPALILAAAFFFIVGLLEPLRFFWYTSALIFAFVIIYYVYSAAKVSLRFHDGSAMRLVILYFVRAVAWVSGAAITTAKRLLGNRS